MNVLTIELLIAAFAGGLFGAALGPLPAFVFTGVLVIVGETLAIVHRTLGPETAVPPVTDAIAFGVVFGPHVSFAGGAAAVAFAAHRGYIDAPGFAYHPAKLITRGLGTKPDVLLVGGAFGVLGHLLLVGSTTISAPWDPVAMAVVLSALAHRVVFGYDLVGNVRMKDLLDMSPFERQAGTAADGSGSTERKRPPVEPWLPYMYRWDGVALLGGAVGVLGAYLAYVTGSAFLAFGISAATLLFICAGVDGIPVTHHITLPASTAVLAVAGVPMTEATPETVAAAIPLWEALALGAVFGLVGALVGELLQRIFYAHAETHLDPPAASIVVTSALVALLAMAGVFETSVWVPHP